MSHQAIEKMTVYKYKLRLYKVNNIYYIKQQNEH
jgi:hypothetical protein